MDVGLARSFLDAIPGGVPLPDALAEELRRKFDAVVMLTWSHWPTEPRSNRYHYASRFARCLPTLFVQEDNGGTACTYEPTELLNLTLVHAPLSTAAKGNDATQTRALARALRERGIFRPLIWVYNPRMKHFLRSVYAPLKVFHATEDYVSGDYYQHPPKFLDNLYETLAGCDLLVAVSEGVERAYREKAHFRGATVVATNGCDHTFLAAGADTKPAEGPPVAFYQGGINNRLDWGLIRDTVRRLPHWQFRFCGRLYFGPGERGLEKIWKQLVAAPNFRYLGELTPEDVRRESHAATVGLIPFVKNPTIVDRSFPLKAFEYVACGLPVVSVPVKSLRAWPELFTFGETGEAFAELLERAALTRRDPRLLDLRAREAARQGYDGKFAQVCEQIVRAEPLAKRDKKVLVLYDDRSTHVKTIEHHLASFLKYSAFETHFAPCTHTQECIYDLTQYDAVVLHYCVRLCFQGHLSPSYEAALKAYPGLKILFAQDEYDCTNTLKQAVHDLGIQCLFTCVPPASIRAVYSEKFFDHVHFVNTLTGYVPPDFDLQKHPVKPLEERQVVIGYRGRDIGYWYGDLAREKLLIGVRMKELCDARGLNTDIAWTHEKRIYGPGWFDFLGSCRATLGTESGSNIFDFEGKLKEAVEQELRDNPAATYEEVHAKHLREHEGKVVMNQISPKLFEAITLRTALVLFEGTYSGVVQPDLHFIPLKKDYSNVDEVLRKVQDDDYLRALTERAYQDVVASGKYSYRAFAREFDAVLDNLLGRDVMPGVKCVQPDNGAGPLVLPLPPQPSPGAVQPVRESTFQNVRRLGAKVLRALARAWRGKRAG